MPWPNLDALCRHCGMRRGQHRTSDDKCPADEVTVVWKDTESHREFMQRVDANFAVRSTFFEAKE
jgi:hypothetical protein